VCGAKGPEKAEGAMLALLMLLLFVGFLIVVPLLLVGLVLRLAVGLVLIPLKIAVFAVRLSLGLVAGLVGLILAGTVLLIPLLPVLLLALFVWMIVRLVRRQPPARLAAD
jgi:hypothetical protein